jgi:hypothetical protein
MVWPLKDDYQAGDALHKVPASDIQTMARIFNYIEGVGVTIEKEPTGYGWKIVSQGSAFEQTFINQQFLVTKSGDNVKIKPGMWVRDGHWNATNYSQDTQQDAKSSASVAADYTGNIYIYALLQNGTGRCVNNWNPSSLDFDNDSAAAYTSWVPTSGQSQGVDLLFVNEEIRLDGASANDGIDPQAQLLPIAELIYDSGTLTTMTQIHKGPRIDGDPLWRAGTAPDTDSDEQQFRPIITYNTDGTALNIDFNPGQWYSPRGGEYITIESTRTISGSEIVATPNGAVYASVLPSEADLSTTYPDPALVPPDTGLIRYSNDTAYDAGAWYTRASTGQRMIARMFAVEQYGAQNVQVLRAAFYHLGGGEIVNYYERPDGKASGIGGVDTGTPRGLSLDYVQDSVSAEHEGELELYKFTDSNHAEAASAFDTFSGDYSVLVRHINTSTGEVTLKYTDISGITFPVDTSTIFDSGITPGDMDTSDTGWVQWIDTWEHNHEAHTFNSDDHTDSDAARYIEANSDALRNNMGGSIGDKGGTLSVDPQARELYDSGPVRSVDWTSRELPDTDGTSALSWGVRQLDDSDGSAAANWDGEGFKLPDTAHTYWHAGNQGLSTQGHSGGIYTDADELDAAIIDVVEMYL